MTFTIVTVAEMQFMAGELVDATGNVTANHQFMHDYAAAYLSSLVKYDILTNWASLNTVKKQLFTEYAARFAAIALIQYNMAGYTSRIEAEDMINVHWARLQEIKVLLEKSDAQDFLGI